VVPNLKQGRFRPHRQSKGTNNLFVSVETPASRTIPTTTSADPNTAPDPEAAKAIAAALPQRFVSVVFDDQHMTMQDALFVRTLSGPVFLIRWRLPIESGFTRLPASSRRNLRTTTKFYANLY